MSEPGWPDLRKSDALWARAQGLIPAGTQTLAKGPGQHVRGVAPKYLLRGRGCAVWDVDGQRYTDLTMAVGPLVLGYGHPAVDRAIREQLDDGITFSLMHPLEVEVAEAIRDVVPGAESVRFSKTGADVNCAAVRLARAHTGRDRVVCCGYHGWHDWYIATTDRDAGVPQAARALTATVPYNDLDAAADAIDDSVACVILEPVVFEAPRPGYLEGLRRLCDERGALLVFDEMWTGFRMHLGGAQAALGVRADLACFSKAVANGMPLSVLAGRRDVMRRLEREVFFFTTFGGEALSLAAAKATLAVLRGGPVLAHLARQGRTLREGYDEIARGHGLGEVTRCVGMDHRGMVTFDPRAGDPLVLRSLVQQEMIRRGVLWAGFHNVAGAHTDEDVRAVLAAYRGALGVLREALDRGDPRAALRGEVVEPVFRRIGNPPRKA